MQQYSAEKLRTLSKNLEIEGWTKDRRKNVLIQRILEKNAKSTKTKEKFQWEYLKSELKKIQQKPQKVRKPRKDRKPLKKGFQEEFMHQENHGVLFSKMNFKTKSLEVQVKCLD